MELKIERLGRLRGEFRPPSDKSLTHRAFMFSALATGQCRVLKPLLGEDCLSTLRCLAAMGLRFERTDGEVLLHPAPEWSQPKTNLDCGNSGTTMRLLSGLIASRTLDVTMVGDTSLSRRPMKRIAEPLRLMGAMVEGDTPPLHIRGGNLKAIEYRTPVASAQIKSCVLLAGLGADGTTWVEEPELSRDHTERMLRAAGVNVLGSGTRVGVQGGTSLNPFEMSIPADISSAAFFLIGGAIAPESEIVLSDVSLNRTRTGILDVLTQCGADWSATDEREECGEPLGSLHLQYRGGLAPFKISGALVPRLIDEIPVLAVLATQCHGVSEIRDARELRVKESDRIELVANGLRSMGAEVDTYEDGMAISGPVNLKATVIDAHGDHRIAMAFAIAGLIAEGETRISGADAIATSFPGFEENLRRLCS